MLNLDNKILGILSNLEAKELLVLNDAPSIPLGAYMESIISNPSSVKTAMQISLLK
jgi:hypothetical protein